MKQEKKKRAKQIRPSITLQQARHISEVTGIMVVDASSFKQALRTVFPDLPEDGNAGAPEGNKNAKNKRNKGE